MKIRRVVWLTSLGLVAALQTAEAGPDVGSASPTDCAPDRGGYCTARVVRYRVRRDAELRLNTALGAVLAVEFPVGTQFSGAPAVGNGAFFGVEGHSGPSSDGRVRLLIRPRLPPAVRDGRPRDFYGRMSNIQVFLVGAPTLNLKVRLAPPERSVYQALIKLPRKSLALSAARLELEQTRARLRQEYQERRAQLDAEVKARTVEQMLEDIVTRFECRPLSERSMRKYLVFRIQRICRIGPRVYVHFSVKNRRRSSVFHFDEMQVVEFGQDPSVGSLDVKVRFERPEPALQFDERVRGVVSFALSEDARQFGPWTFRLVEDGGANRRVVIEDVGF